MHAANTSKEGRTARCTIPPRGDRESIGGLLRRNHERLADHAILREKDSHGSFAPVSWRQFLLEVVALASHLESKGVGAGDRVAVISRNRKDFLVTEFAVMGLEAVHVPIFTGYSADETNALLAHCRPKVIAIAGPEQMEKIRPPESTELLLTFDPLPSPGRSASGPGDAATRPEPALPTVCLRDLSGPTEISDPRVRRFLDRAASVDPDTPSLMMYTSGTSGEQKGVLLTHDNILSQQRALAAIWSITPRDRVLTYLPWHHSFGGIFEKYAALSNGATLTLDDSYGKDLALLMANWREIRPTIYFSVPLIHQQLVDHVRSHPEEERQIYHDEFRFVFTAAAPLPGNISAFFEDRKIPVVEGWGLTETAPCCTVTDLTEQRRTPGMVGYPIPGVTIRIADDGEILVRGPNVMIGYFENPEATARAFPGDDWFHTGDLGELLESGGLRLLTRKDRVFKMLNAEKVIPTLIENDLASRNRYIRHVLVVGQGQRFLAALIFPNFALIEEEFGADHELAERTVKESYRHTILELNRSLTVKYEQLQAFAVVGRELSVENQELTPSMKVRVQNVLDASGAFVDAIYDPARDCDCRFLSRVMRMRADGRPCPKGEDRTLDQCHECRNFVFAAPAQEDPGPAG